MGSTGSGNFSDYKGYSQAEKGTTGGFDKLDQCSLAFSDFLEDVETCDYYLKYGKLPPKNTVVSIVFDKRMVAKDEKGLIIGYLPTKYNYLRACIAGNYVYEGIINAVLTSPVKAVSIAITPLKL